ncbi:MAG TPA: ATP-binding cassette domain-containing protein, partial [Anaerolineae bacterium]|nr:ATP-binding cassette domain-containing protein [Anaerolineae bacterium]
MAVSNSSSPPVLELHGITKAFPGVLANDHIDLVLHRGEILTLLGENGAGKSTLMNILYGLYSPDEGEIIVQGKRVEIRNPNDAIAQGIGMVHQHFMLVPVLTVTENVMLGVESIKNGIFLDRAAAARRIREISAQYGLEVDPDAYIKELPVGVQQRVEIIKLLYREADILILDEPTAVLTPQEVDDLFKVIRSLVDGGKSVIFITHKLKEVMEIADRITVLRNGRVVGTITPSETDEQSLAAMMVGRQVLLQVEKGPAHPGETVLDVAGLTVRDDRGNPAVREVSFQVRAGEVLGV